MGEAGELNFFFGWEKCCQDTDQMCCLIPKEEARLFWLYVHITHKKEFLGKWFLQAAECIQLFNVLFLFACKRVAL